MKLRGANGAFTIRQTHADLILPHSNSFDHIECKRLVIATYRNNLFGRIRKQPVECFVAHTPKFAVSDRIWHHCNNLLMEMHGFFKIKIDSEKFLKTIIG